MQCWRHAHAWNPADARPLRRIPMPSAAHALSCSRERLSTRALAAHTFVAFVR
jgi:hypothetical protein